jgi:hypothetical protein
MHVSRSDIGTTERPERLAYCDNHRKYAFSGFSNTSILAYLHKDEVEQ